MDSEAKPACFSQFVAPTARSWTGGQPLQAEGNKEDGKEGSERARY